MPNYRPPLRDIQFVLHELLDVPTQLRALPPHAEHDADTINQVLEEAGKFCVNVTLPLNQSGDREGCRYLGHGVVETPRGFKEAFQKYRDGGWPGLICDPEMGGQGLPQVVNCSVY